MYSTVEEPIGGNESWTNFMKSGIVMEYLVGTNIVVYQADMYSENPEKTVETRADGFTASVDYPDLEIGFDVSVTLTDKGITVDIPKESITESSDQYKISSIYVYPFLGSSLLGEREGYMMIPDGSGALIHLDDNNGKFSQPYSKMIYGENVGIDDPFVLSLFNGMNPFNDTEKILMPVYGMVHTDTEMGYIGIIEEGQYSAKLESYPNGAILPYNWITSKFIYRQVYNQPTSQESGTMVVRQRTRNDFNVKVHFNFVSGDAADYVGLAKEYREYLLENDLLNVTESDFKLRTDFLGAELEDGLLFKKTIPMTTFKQAEEILSDIQANGRDQLMSVFTGWQDGGPYGGLPIRHVAANNALDDDLSLTAFQQSLEDKGIALYLKHDGLRINTEELSNTQLKVMRKFNKRRYEEEVYGNVYDIFHYLHPETSADLLTDLKEDYLDQELSGVMLSGITHTLFSYSEGSKEFDRMTTKNTYQPVVEDYSASLDLVLDQPFSYLWGSTDAFMNTPVQSSNYVFTDEDIPFLSLVLSGTMPLYSEYVNFQANQDEFFLQLVEQGLNPSFLLTAESPQALINTNSSWIYSSQYDRYKETIEHYYDELSAVHDATSGAMIDDYTREGKLTTVTYDNGTIVYVNYADQTLNSGSETIEAMSYKVVTGQ
ncbi:DUF5696 domain-containing protein [Halolactibacillus sp. JCM 19043]|nr:DUF5696 domain-containing protein [Halolactibacillus sp. JCM 19043]